LGNIEIKSDRQSGGITAQNVSFGSSTPPSEPPKKSRAKSIFWWVVGVATVIGTVAAVYEQLKG
jgi:hypothetical protein